MNNSEYLLAATNGGCYILYSTDYVESSLYIYSTGFTVVIPKHTRDYRVNMQANQVLTAITEGALGQYYVETIRGKLNLEDGYHKPNLGVPSIEIIPLTNDTVARVSFIGN